MKIKVFLCLIFVCLNAIHIEAQTDADDDDFWKFRQNMFEEYEEFRKQMNEEYVQFLGEGWKDYELQKGIEPATGPKPVAAPISSGKKDLTSSSIKGYVSAPKPVDVSNVRIEKPDRKHMGTKMVSFMFFGTRFVTSHDLTPKRIGSVSESNVAALWKYFSKSQFNNMVRDIVEFKEKHNLNDWATYRLVDMLAEQTGELLDKNTRIIFSHFILRQCDYDARLCAADNKIEILLPMKEMMFGRGFYTLDNVNFFIISADNSKKSRSFRAPDLDKKAGRRVMSMQISKPIQFTNKPHESVLKYKDFSTLISVNKNLIDFYLNYPTTDMNVYPSAILGADLTEQLKTSVGNQIKDMSKAQALQWLLSLVQHGFKYMIDETQFGREKAFFVDEIFYYPYSDCEDRAIFYSWLVKNLLQLDVVLLQYPKHIATAVDAANIATGKTVEFKNKRYVICDPTYINGSVGECMPMYAKVQPGIIVF